MKEEPSGTFLKPCEVRTFLVFLDLPKHLEFRAGGFPLLNEGVEIDLDLIVRDHLDPRKNRSLKGIYVVKRRILKYSNERSSRSGLSQFLEVELSKGGSTP